jgi:hypothetical protein
MCVIGKVWPLPIVTPSMPVYSLACYMLAKSGVKWFVAAVSKTQQLEVEAFEENAMAASFVGGCLPRKEKTILW